MDANVLFFFARDPAALALFESLRERLNALWPQSTLKVQKTQITFLDPRGYCYASLRGKGRLIVSFGLGAALSSPRLFAVATPAPGRYTHHVAVRDESELDAELLGWIAQSHAFMQRQKRR